MCAKAVKSYALLNITAKGSPLAEIYTKGCFLKVRNFKKTLSLVLSVLMLVSCCSVVFSTFATAYTTNDTAGSANYGVYTYDFIKEDGTSAYGTNGSISHNLMACGGKSNLSLSNSTQIERRFLAGASYIGTEGNRKGMHLVGYTATSLADSASWANNWGSRAFILDDTAISKPADAANGANFLTLQDHTTYTFIVKYKLESLDAAYYVGVPGNTYNPNGIGYDPTISSSVNPPEGKTYEAGQKASEGEFASTGAYIGLGYMDPSAIKETGVSNTAGSSGQSIAFTNGWSDRIDAVQDEWQYLNVTVNADDITLHTTSGMQTKYVHLLVRSAANEKPVMFQIDSITVVAIDNDYVDIVVPYDENKTEQGFLTESVKVGPKGYEYNFIEDKTGTSSYVTKSHDVMANSEKKYTSGKNKDKYMSYVDETGMHLTPKSASWVDKATSPGFMQRAFVRDPDVKYSMSNVNNSNCYLTIKENDNATYYFSMKYRVEDLDPDDDGTLATNIKIGIGFFDHNFSEAAVFPSGDTNGNGGMTTQLSAKSFTAAFTPTKADVDEEGNNVWRYLDFSVNSNDLVFRSGATDLQNKYIVIQAASSNAQAVTFQIESLYVARVDNSSTVDVKSFEPEEETINTAEFDLSRFAYNAKNMKDKVIVSGETQGSEAIAALDLAAITNNGNGSITLPTNHASVYARFPFYERNSIFADPTSVNDNALIIKSGYRYVVEFDYAYDSAESTKNIGFYLEANKDKESTDNKVWVWGDVSRTTIVADEADENVSAFYLTTGQTGERTKKTFSFNATDDYDGKTLIIRATTGDTNHKLTIYGIKVTYYSTTSSTPVIEETVDGNKTYYSLPSNFALPRPQDKDGKYASHWVDTYTGKVVSYVGATGYKTVTPAYKNYTVDFDLEGGTFDPNEKLGLPGWGNSAKVETLVDGEENRNNVLHFYNYTWSVKDGVYYWGPTNNAVVGLGDDSAGITVKPNTNYTIKFRYYIKSIDPNNAKFTNLKIYQSAKAGIGAAQNKIHAADAVDFSMVNAGKWVDATVTFTSKDKDLTDVNPYLILVIGGGNNSLGGQTYPNTTAKENEAKAETESFTNIYFDNFEIFETIADNTVEESYSSIREEIAANEQTSALRVSAAISEAAANAADEIGFIALPTAKASGNWYKFDADGKLASGALSVKVKDVNGLGIKDAEGNDLGINELLAPSTVPVANGQKAYQVIITGLQTIGKTGAGLRNDAISVVLYTKNAEGNYTYYFANEVSYDQTMTMYAMAGKDFAKYEY